MQIFEDDKLSRYYPSKTIETLERARVTLEFREPDWLDTLNVTRFEYLNIRAGTLPPPEKGLENLASRLNVNIQDILRGEVDFKSLRVRLSHDNTDLPLKYRHAAHGRRRTTITSVDFIEGACGWRMRHEVLKHFGVSERALLDPFAPISIQFITEMCDFLYRRQFSAEDFFAMGAYSYVGNQGSLLAKIYSEMPHPIDIYEHMFGEMISLYEQNCSYHFQKLTKTSAFIEVRSNKDVAAEIGVRELGNQHLCRLKAGFMACAPAYLGLPFASVKEVRCVHDGQPSCLFKIDFEHADYLVAQSVG